MKSLANCECSTCRYSCYPGCARLSLGRGSRTATANGPKKSHRKTLLFSGPKYDSEQPTYAGFERDVFKTVSDHFYGLPQPLLTYDLYELFINVLGKGPGGLESLGKSWLV